MRDPVREEKSLRSRRKPEVEGVDMPKPHEFLSAEQRDGSTLQAEEIYTETWEWLKKVVSLFTGGTTTTSCGQ